MANLTSLLRTATICTLVLMLAAPVSYGGSTGFDVALEIEATPDPAVSGGHVTVTLVASNLGTNGAPDPAISLTTPPGTTFESVETSAQVTEAPSQGGTGLVICKLDGFLDPDASFEVEVVLNVTAEPNDTLVIEASAAANSPSPDDDPTNNSASVEVAVTGSTVADLAVEVFPESDEAGSGAPFAFSVDVSNESEGEEPARGVQLTIEIPEGSTFSSVSDFDGNCSAPEIGETGSVVCSFDELFPGDVVTIDVEIDVVANPGHVLTLTASVTSESEDPEPANDEAFADVDVVPGPPAELDWDEPEEGGDLDFLPPRNLVADDDGAGAFGHKLRRATVIGYNIYGSASPNVMPSPSTFITSVGPTVTNASVTSAPAGTFFVVTAQYGGGESGPSNEASAQVPAATLTSVKVKGTKITAKGTGFSDVVSVFVDGIPFVAAAKVKQQAKVTQKGTLVTGQTVGAYLAQHPSVLITFRNSNGGIVAYRHPQ